MEVATVEAAQAEVAPMEGFSAEVLLAAGAPVAAAKVAVEKAAATATVSGYRKSRPGSRSSLRTSAPLD